MFYGWGTQTREWKMGDGQTVMCIYKYFSLMFIFKLATKKRWMIVGNDRSQDQEVTRAEIETRYGDDAPNLNLWDKFGLILGIVGLFVVLFIVSVVGG